MENITRIDHQRADLNLKKFYETKDVELFQILENARDKWFKKHYNEKIRDILDSNKD